MTKQIYDDKYTEDFQSWKVSRHIDVDADTEVTFKSLKIRDAYKTPLIFSTF